MNAFLMFISILCSFAAFGLFWLVALFPLMGPRWLLSSLTKRLRIHWIAVFITFFLLMTGVPNAGFLLAFNFLMVIATFIVSPNSVFPALEKCDHVGVSENPYNEDVEVIGIEINKTAIAYPVWEFVASRHIVNDVIDDHRFAITFCPACRSAAVYAAYMNDPDMVFKVAGLWRKNMTFIDSVSKSLWQQVTGQCIAGRLVGRELTGISFRQLKLEQWIREYPKTMIAVLPDHPGQSIIPEKVFHRILREGLIQKVNAPGLQKKDLRLPAHEMIAGVRINSIAKAYPVEVLRKKNSVIDKIDNVEIVITYDEKSGEISAVMKKDKKSIRVEQLWWLAWYEFYPETLLYSPV